MCYRNSCNGTQKSWAASQRFNPPRTAPHHLVKERGPHRSHSADLWPEEKHCCTWLTAVRIAELCVSRWDKPTHSSVRSFKNQTSSKRVSSALKQVSQYVLEQRSDLVLDQPSTGIWYWFSCFWRKNHGLIQQVKLASCKLWNDKNGNKSTASEVNSQILIKWHLLYRTQKQ